MTREEIERVLKEELRLTQSEGAPEVWGGSTIIPELATQQLFPIIIHLVDDQAVAVGINLGLKVDRNQEAVYEYLLEINGKIALGEFLLDDETRISIGAEMSCGTSTDSYFSREELALMVKVLFDAVKEHYNQILQMIHGGARKEPGGLLKWLKSARERR